MNLQQATEMPVADSDFVLKSSNKLATCILNCYEHCWAVQTFFNQPWAYLIEQYKLYLEGDLKRQQATELPVADSDFVLKSSNKLATGIITALWSSASFLKQPWAYLNSTNFI